MFNKAFQRYLPNYLPFWMIFLDSLVLMLHFEKSSKNDEITKVHSRSLPKPKFSNTHRSITMRCCLKTPVIFSRHQQHTTTIITSKILVQCFSKDFFIFSILALKMGCCETMLRYIIFLINFVFFLASVAVIAIGAYIQIQMKTYLEFIGKYLIKLESCTKKIFHGKIS